MIYGLVWPMSEEELVYPSKEWAITFREAGFTHIRMDLPVMRDRANAEASVQIMIDAGLNVFPILSWPVGEPDTEAMQGYARWYVERFPGTEWVELGNEPWILYKTHGWEYLRVAKPMAEALEEADPNVKVVLAMDLFDHVDGNERGWPGVDEIIEFIAASPRRYADLHPYRNPYRATYSPWGSRDFEYNAICDRLGHDRFVYGEVGWKPSEGKYQASGEYHIQELDIDAHHKIPMVCIYTHIADLINPEFDFGLWVAESQTEVRPSPAATAISEYLLGDPDACREV